MKRRVMQMLFALSVLVALTTITLWVRAFWGSDISFIGRSWSHNAVYGSTDVYLLTSTRHVSLLWRRDWRDVPWSVQERDISTSRFHAGHYREAARPFALLIGPPSDPLLTRLGFEHDHRRIVAGPTGIEQRYVSVPSWLAILACAAPTALAGRHLWQARRLRRRRQRGLCPACGYDLRGASHERCPECGAGSKPRRYDGGA